MYRNTAYPFTACIHPAPLHHKKTLNYKKIQTYSLEEYRKGTLPSN